MDWALLMIAGVFLTVDVITFFVLVVVVVLSVKLLVMGVCSNPYQFERT